VALEEARAENEELQSSNEELPSSNEELGTTKEELQSANDELNTANEELDTRNQQLRALNDDLINLFTAMNVPILRVDRDLCLRRFNPAAEKCLRLLPADLDQPIRYLQSRLGALPDVEGMIREVIDTLSTQSYEIQDPSGRWWSVTLHPYRRSDHRLDGAVLTFVDVDSIKRAFQASEEARRYMDAIVETVREPLVILTPELRVERANDAFYRVFRMTRQETEQQIIYELANGQWNIPRLRSVLESVLHRGKSLADIEVKHTFPGIGARVMLVNARQLCLKSRLTDAILLAFEDRTERRQAEQIAAERLKKTDRELDRTKEELRALAAALMTAREEEQRRIARELHDDLAQRLGILERKIGQFCLGPIAEAHPEVLEMLTTLQHQIGDASNVVRDFSHKLHPAILDYLGLVPALRRLANEFASTRSAPVRFTSRGVFSSLPWQLALAIYRIAQEALRNANKHAQTGAVSISVNATTADVRLTIKDTGPGFNPGEVRGLGGLGIVNMQERAHLAGGNLRIHSQPGSGTRIQLRVPLPKPGQ